MLYVNYSSIKKITVQRMNPHQSDFKANAVNHPVICFHITQLTFILMSTYVPSIQSMYFPSHLSLFLCLSLSLCLQGYVTKQKVPSTSHEENLQQHQHCNILILVGIKFPDLRKNKFLLFNPFSLHYFVIEALADQYNLWITCSFHLTL